MPKKSYDRDLRKPSETLDMRVSDKFAQRLDPPSRRARRRLDLDAQNLPQPPLPEKVHLRTKLAASPRRLQNNAPDPSTRARSEAARPSLLETVQSLLHGAQPNGDARVTLPDGRHWVSWEQFEALIVKAMVGMSASARDASSMAPGRRKAAPCRKKESM